MGSVEVFYMAVANPSHAISDQDLSEISGIDLGSEPRAELPETGAEPRRRLLFVSSAGGHLAQLLQLKPWWINHDRQWVSFDLPDARSKLEGEEMVAAYHPTTRNVVNLARNTPLAWKVLRDFKPDVVISNGAGVAVPFFAVAKTMGIPTVYLEVYDRIDSQTLTGKLCRPLASMFCVQWPEQQELYAGSNLTGPLY